jgi:hypothetical protein
MMRGSCPSWRKLRATKFYELINGGKVKTVTIGRRRLVLIASIREMLEAQGR